MPLTSRLPKVCLKTFGYLLLVGRLARVYCGASSERKTSIVSISPLIPTRQTRIVVELSEYPILNNKTTAVLLNSETTFLSFLYHKGAGLFMFLRLSLLI